MVVYRGSTGCPSCGNTNTKEQIFCQKCEDESIDYYEMQIAPGWVNMLQRLDESKRFSECVKFADRHGYKVDILILKLRIKYSVTVHMSKENIFQVVNSEGQ